MPVKRRRNSTRGRAGSEGYAVAGYSIMGLREAKKTAQREANSDGRAIRVEDRLTGRTVATVYPKGRNNPATTSGYVKCKAVKIVRNKAGKAVSVKIKT